MPQLLDLKRLIRHFADYFADLFAYLFSPADAGV
jgi:hypothetical protein